MPNVIYELDDLTVEMVGEMFAQMKAAEVAINTMLHYYARKNNIRGTVKLGADRRTVEVVRAPGKPMPGESARDVMNDLITAG